jgi:hypothetical protein
MVNVLYSRFLSFRWIERESDPFDKNDRDDDRASPVRYRKIVPSTLDTIASTV